MQSGLQAAVVDTCPMDVVSLGPDSGGEDEICAFAPHIPDAETNCARHPLQTLSTEHVDTVSPEGRYLIPDVHRTSDGRWVTYNFEVEDTHTYIAGGVRVHNVSEWATNGTGLDFNVPGHVGEFGYVTQSGKFHAIDYSAYKTAALEKGVYGKHSSGYYSQIEQASFAEVATGGSQMDATRAAFSAAQSMGIDTDSQDGFSIAAAMAHRGYQDASGDDNGKPIIIDLDGDGVEVAPRDQNFTLFDFDDDGYAERTAWVGADDGFLVFDEGNDGRITSARELALAEWTEALDTDLEALREVFDTNKDGVLESRDGDWSKFKIWQDHNSDGVVDANELHTLAHWGVKAINLDYSSDDAIILSDGTVVHGFMDVELVQGSRIADNDGDGKAEAADVALAHDLLGMKTSDNGAGTTRYELEYGVTEKHRVLQNGESNFTIDHRNVDENAPEYFVSASGNTSANRLDATHASIGVVLDGGAGNDTLIGGVENDLLFGGDGADAVLGGDGHDTIIVDAADLTSGSIDGGDGYDAVLVDGDANVSIVMENLDVEFVQSGGGNDTISVLRDRNGQQLIDPTNADAYDIVVSARTERVWVRYIEYESRGYNGNRGNYSEDTTYETVQLFDETIEHTGSVDWLIENVGEDGGDEFSLRQFAISGGAGNDTIIGGVSRDTIVAGEGNDSINGGSGNDVYVFRAGDGHDVIEDHGIGVTSQLAHKTVGYYQRYIWDYKNGGNENNSWTDPIYRENSGQHRLPYLQVDEVDVTGGLDTISLGYGIRFEDLVFSQVGNDLKLTIDADNSITVKGFADDRYKVEILSFASGMALDLSRVIAGAGTNASNTLNGTDANDVLRGFGGNDTLSGNGAADFLYGGTGNDRLEGGADDDTYYWVRGDGHDTIYDTEGVDGLFFGSDIAYDDLSFSLIGGSNLRVGITGTGAGSITVNGFNNAANQIEHIVLDDGTVLYVPDMAGLALATDGDDTISWSASALWIDAGDGNDTVHGSADGDILIGGAGVDKLYGYGGNDVLDAGAGVAGQWDAVTGYEGNDTFLFDTSGTNLSVDGSGTYGDGTDTFVFEDLTLADISWRYHDYSGDTNGNAVHGMALIADWSKNGKSGSIQFTNYATNIEEYRFADGSMVSTISPSNVGGGAGLHGSADGDTLIGGAGTDGLYGYGGNDVLDAGAGVVGQWDAVTGYEGNDTFLFDTSGTNLSVDGSGTYGDGTDTFVFEDLTLADISWRYHDYSGDTNGNAVHGVALIADWSKDGKSGTVQFTNHTSNIERYEFADGTVVSSIQSPGASGGADAFLYGTATNDLVTASNAKDVLYGYGGRDVLSGLRGDDLLFGDVLVDLDDPQSITDLVAYIEQHLADGRNEGQYDHDGWGHRIGDFNNDGLQDIIQIGRSVLDANGISQGGKAELFLAQQDGGFSRGALMDLTVAADYSLFDVVSADFNGDGSEDLAWVLNSYGNTGGRIEVHLSNGDGTFTGHPHLQPQYGSGADYSAFDIMTGDFDGNGAADLVWVLNSSGTTGGRIEVHLSNGDGTFAAHPHLQPHYGSGADYSAFDVMTGDFNADGLTDLAWTLNSSGSTGGRIETHFSNGDGTFTTGSHLQPTTQADYSAFEVLTGDFNGDRRTDFAWVLPSSGTTGGRIETLLSLGDGTFANGGHHYVNYGQDYTGWEVHVGDFDGDGRSDFAWTQLDQVAGTLHVASQLSYGTGVFSNNLHQTYNVYTGGLSAGEALVVTTGDFDGDGRTDIAAVVDGQLDANAQVSNLYSVDGVSFAIGGNNDTLNGGEGADILVGGAGNDTFVFNATSGDDTIIDFQAGVALGDRIMFEGVFANLQDVLAASAQVQDDTVISYSETVDGQTYESSVLLNGVHLSNLHENDFVFL